MKSKYFTLAELCSTNSGLTNVPDWEQVDNLYLLTKMVLDPLRALYGRPIKINSGYRSVEVNKAIGGARTSQHLFGLAADITGGDKVSNAQMYNLIVAHLPFDQVINEKDFTWVHVSHNNVKNRMEQLKL
jgi:hypothetical protein